MSIQVCGSFRGRKFTSTKVNLLPPWKKLTPIYFLGSTSTSTILLWKLVEASMQAFFFREVNLLPPWKQWYSIERNLFPWKTTMAVVRKSATIWHGPGRDGPPGNAILEVYIYNFELEMEASCVAFTPFCGCGLQ